MSEKTVRIHRSIDDVNENQWNTLVEQSERGSVFHRTGWLRAVERGLGRPARHLVVEKDGNPISVFPNFLVDVGVPDVVPVLSDGLGLKRLASTDPGFGGPLFVGDEESNFEVAFEHAERLLSATDAVHHLLKPSGADFARYTTYLADRGYRPTVRSCRFVIDLRQGWDAVEEGMARSKRSNLDSARDSPLTVENPPLDESVLSSFYDAYRAAMDRVDGTTYPFGFFESLATDLADRVEVFVARLDGEFAGAQLYLLDDERSTVREFFRAIDADYFEHNPTELLGEAAMKWAIDREYDEYDLGSTTPDFTDGSFTYKDELGAEIRPVLLWERGGSAVRWHAYRAGRWLLRNRDGRKK
ncbi:GNAT family N-acetyltransferase [Halorussus sp. AFM4]|uniref:GNAT family N-acetyltransferase n=1 Tax=Halorussus sp. AFM4 TaxID=3421651 RepID=UPI003EBB178B